MFTMIESLECRWMLSSTVTSSVSTSRQTFGDTLSSRAVQNAGTTASGAAVMTSSAMGMQTGSSSLGQVSGLGGQMQNTGGTTTAA